MLYKGSFFLIFLFTFLCCYSDCPWGDYDNVKVFCSDESPMGITFETMVTGKPCLDDFGTKTKDTKDVVVYKRPEYDSLSAIYKECEILYLECRKKYDGNIDSTMAICGGYSALTSFCASESDELIKSTKSYTCTENTVGCLKRVRIPLWFMFKMDEDGDLLMQITNLSSDGKLKDMDFICWGPFSGESKTDVLENVCSNNLLTFVDDAPKTDKAVRVFKDDSFYKKGSTIEGELWNDKYLGLNKWSIYSDNFRQGLYPFSGSIRDCSYHTSKKEYVYIPNTRKGEWYIMLISNFSDEITTVNFNRIEHSASTDCSVVLDVFSNGPVCEGEDLNLYANNFPFGSRFEWSGPDGFTSNSAKPVIKNVTKKNAGEYSLIVYYNGEVSNPIKLNVEVITSDPIERVVEIEQGGVYSYAGKEYSAGDYVLDVKSPKGCKGKLNLHVIEVGAQPKITGDSVVCNGEPVSLSVSNLNEGASVVWKKGSVEVSSSSALSIAVADVNDAGVYIAEVTDAGSVISLPVNLIVNPVYNESVSLSIIEGEVLNVGNEVITKAGEYTIIHKTESGCDSIVTYTVSMETPQKFTPFIETVNPVCEGGSSVLFVKDIPTGYSVAWHSPSGDEISKDNPLELTNLKVSDAGVYSVVLSLNERSITLNADIVVYPSYNETKQVVIKEGESVSINGKSVSVAGTYKESLNTSKGCDSIIVHNVTVEKPEPVYTPKLEATTPVCAGEAITFKVSGAPVGASYAWTKDGAKLSADASYSIKSASAKDSGEYQLVISHKGKTYPLSAKVQVNSSYNSSKEIVIKEGESVSINGKSVSVAGTYKESLKTSKGCDSIIVYNVTVEKPEPVYTPKLEATTPVCAGESIAFNVTGAPTGASYSWKKNGAKLSADASYSIKSASAKDSGEYQLVISHKGKTYPLSAKVQVNPSYNISKEIVIKEGESVNINGKSVSVAGTYKETLKTDKGCDSIIVYNVTVEKPEEKPLVIELFSNAPVCKGETLVLGANGVPAGADYKWVGPDYFVSYDAEPVINDVTLKADGYYRLFVTYNGKVYESAPVYVDVKSTYTASITEHIMSGEFYMFGDKEVSEAGDYQETFIASNGCDSVVSLHLDVTQKFDISLQNNSPVCDGDELSISLSGAPANADFEWSGPAGFASTDRNLVIKNVSQNNAGLYVVTVTFDGKILGQFETKAVVNSNYVHSKKVVLTEGETYLCGDLEIDEAGTYSKLFVSQNGCDSLVNILVEVSKNEDDYELSISGDKEICEGGEISLVPDLILPSAEYVWTGPSGFVHNGYSVNINKAQGNNAGTYSLSVKDKKGNVREFSHNVQVNPIYRITEEFIMTGTTFKWHDMELAEPGDYRRVLKTEAGCDSVIALKLKRLAEPEYNLEPEDRLIVPSPVLSPNGDGIQDRWQIKNIEKHPDAIVEIYDRNGKLLVSYKSYDNQHGWDGTYNGRPMPTTDYWYVITLDVANRVYTGHFTLLRQ